MNSQACLSLLRQALTFFGALLAGHGLVSADQSSTFVNNIMVAVPALVSMGSIAWSVYAHYKMSKVPSDTVVSLPSGAQSTVQAAVEQKPGPVLMSPSKPIK